MFQATQISFECTSVLKKPYNLVGEEGYNQEKILFGKIKRRRGTDIKPL